MTDSPAAPERIAELATSHGLLLDPASIRVVEAGLDYRVAFAEARDGADWVLRMPRREDVAAKIADEARILSLVREELPVAVPDWRIQTSSLIAYPLLPGSPGLTLDPATGEPAWHFDPTSPTYAESLGRFIATLHRIDPERARAAGIPVQSPDEVRAEWASSVARVAAELPIADALLRQLEAWLDDDSLWPDVTTFTHGELYPAHVLIDDSQQVRAVLDWTTAKVGDPIVDFAYQHMMAGPSFETTLRAYEAAGGRAHARAADRCAAILAAGPVRYGLYALTTGDAEHRAAAAAQLDPS